MREVSGSLRKSTPVATAMIGVGAAFDFHR